ncbi:hypothetical protein VPNG_10126 [Cytospora leucostoma]|uniref:NADAR domain-containing protein n=1 Tax=Cytospora leucostoma TaxID=1230097 RepID=A0A423VEX0_9PEZI|nr:hypothetical protein VPNG_10126 [Cytospora leucostoma]
MVRKVQRDKKQTSLDLQPPTASGPPPETVDKRPIFFHKEWEYFGFMSNYHPARFTAPDPATWLPGSMARPPTTASVNTDEGDTTRNIQFLHSEQYYMYCKAVCFGDQDAAKRILDATSPADCKEAGRSVQGFSEEVWSKDDLKVRIMEEALWCKFGGRELEESLRQAGEGGNASWMSKEAKLGHLNDLGRRLLATGSRQLAEAARRDRYWGIGYGERQRPQYYERSWGRNQLGKSLMVIRERLRRLIEGEAES